MGKSLITTTGVVIYVIVHVVIEERDYEEEEEEKEKKYKHFLENRMTCTYDQNVMTRLFVMHVWQK